MKIFIKVQRLGPAAALLALGVFLSRFMGLIRDKVIAFYFGAGLETDLYNAAFVIPDFINYLLAGGYFSITLIPLLARFFQEDEKDGWAFFSTAFSWITLAAALVTALAWGFAAELARISAPGFTDPAVQTRLAHFLRIILPAQVCFLPGACFTALLLLRRQFAVPALTPLIYNSGIILAGLLGVRFAPERGMEGFCWGVLGGAALGSLILPWAAVRAGGLSLTPRFRHPGLRQFLILALPLMLGQSIVALDEQLVRFFGSFDLEGAISRLSYARRIMMVPVGVVAQAAGMASFPFLVSLAASGNKEEFNRTVNQTLLYALLIILPLAAWMAVASLPIIRLIFQQGLFSPQAARDTAFLLVIMLCSTPFWAIQQVLGRGFYAHRNTLTPVLAGTASTLAGFPLYVLLTRWCGAPGVALAGVCGMGFYAALLAWRWKSHFRGEALRNIGRRLVTLLGLSLPCAAAAFPVNSAFSVLLPASPYLAAFLSLGSSLVIFCAVFACFCRFLTPALWKEGLEILAALRKK